MSDIKAILVLVVYAGIIFTLVRPGSQGPGLISAIATGISDIIKAGMGDGSVPATPTKKAKS